MFGSMTVEVSESEFEAEAVAESGMAEGGLFSSRDVVTGGFGLLTDPFKVGDR